MPTDDAEKAVPMHMSEMFSVLRHEAKELESRTSSDVLVAFAAGCLSLVVGLRMFAFLRYRGQSHDQVSPYSALDRMQESPAAASATQAYQHLHEVNETEVRQVSIGFEIE